MTGKGSYSFLAKNLGLLTISSFATKLLSFFLVPLYTGILTTGEYGAFDLTNTAVGVLLPVLTGNIMEAVLRFSMEEQGPAVFAVGRRLSLAGAALLGLCLALAGALGLLPLQGRFYGWLLAVFFVQAMNGLVTCYARGRGEIRPLAVSSVVNACVVLGGNLLFLLVLGWGLDGYYLANVLGPLAQSCCLLPVLDTGGPQPSRELSRRMLGYSAPLTVSAVSWWVNNLSDRLVVTAFWGVAQNGIYSVASKIPGLLNLVQTIFNQAWILSAVKDFDREDREGFFKTTYSLYSGVMVLGCSCLILLNRPLSRLLYSGEFYEAWRYVPFLTIAIVFGAMSGYLEGFFAAGKQTAAASRSTVAGAAVNVGLNLLLVPRMGPMGAAAATAVSYFLIWVIRLVQCRRLVRLELRLFRDASAYALLVTQGVLLVAFPRDSLGLYLVQGCLTLVLAGLYRQEAAFALAGLASRLFAEN